MLKISKKIPLAVSMICFASMAYAKQIVCPSINSIQQAAQSMDDVMPLGGKYIVTSKVPTKIDGITWYVMMGDIAAESCDEALLIAKKSLQQTSIRQQQYPVEVEEGLYSCNYGPGNIKATFYQGN